MDNNLDDLDVDDVELLVKYKQEDALKAFLSSAKASLTYSKYMMKHTPDDIKYEYVKKACDDSGYAYIIASILDSIDKEVPDFVTASIAKEPTVSREWVKYLFSENKPIDHRLVESISRYFQATEEICYLYVKNKLKVPDLLCDTLMWNVYSCYNLIDKMADVYKYKSQEIKQLLNDDVINSGLQWLFRNMGEKDSNSEPWDISKAIYELFSPEQKKQVEGSNFVLTESFKFFFKHS